MDSRDVHWVIINGFCQSLRMDNRPELLMMCMSHMGHDLYCQNSAFARLNQIFQAGSGLILTIAYQSPGELFQDLTCRDPCPHRSSNFVPTIV